MIRHMLKLVWNRKRTNLLIVVEIFVAFLVVFAVIALGVYYLDNYRRPLGYSIENVWSVTIHAKAESDMISRKPSKEMRETYQQLYLAVQGFDEILSVAGLQTVPYSNSTWMSGYEAGQFKFNYEVDSGTDTLQDVMGIRLTKGRWFQKSDDALGWEPVVVNEEFARMVFGAENPLGKNIDEENLARHQRIVGVMEDFRKGGEFSAKGPFVFQREVVNDPDGLPSLVVKVRPGIGSAFEERLMAAMQGIARNWSFEIESLADKRHSALQVWLAPLITAGLVAGFLMLMVGLGLVGVLWQSVTQRTTEIGLRRAEGATARDVYFQILGELFMITSMALALGVIVVAQLPILNLIAVLSARIYIYSILVSMALMYLLTLMCAVYPSRLATKIQPAEALHYE